MDLITYTTNQNLTNQDEIIDIGKKKLKNNEFMKDLCDLMENEKFLNFYKKYMMDWSSIKCTSIYMRLYSEFKNKYKSISGEDLDKHIIVFILSKIMTDSTLRQVSIKTIEKIQGDILKVDFFEEFEKFLKKNRSII
jgi:hypothetical protein